MREPTILAAAVVIAAGDALNVHLCSTGITHTQRGQPERERMSGVYNCMCVWGGGHINKFPSV